MENRQSRPAILCARFFENFPLGTLAEFPYLEMLPSKIVVGQQKLFFLTYC